MKTSATRRPSGRAILLLILALSLVAGACASNSSLEPGATPPQETPAAGGPLVVDDPIAVDWGALDGLEPTQLSNGWTLEDCDGEGPHVCLRDADGTLLGTLELLNFPMENALAGAVDDEALYAAFEARLAETVTSIQDGRREECPGYTFALERTERLEVDGLPALAYTTVGTDADGVESERHRSYILVAGGQVWLIAATSYGDDACMPRGEHELDPEGLRVIESDLDRIAAGSDLPDDGWAMLPGTVVETDGGLDGGRLWFIGEAGKQRIQQPRPMSEDDVEELGLTRGQRLAVLRTGDEESGSYFAVLPPDGPDARLHVVLGRTIHEVVVQRVNPDMVEETPELVEPVLTRLVRG